MYRETRKRKSIRRCYSQTFRKKSAKRDPSLPDWNFLPLEIVEKIFQFCIWNEGHIVLKKLGSVSYLWAKVIGLKKFWKNVDFVKGSEQCTNQQLGRMTRNLFPLLIDCETIRFNNCLTNRQFVDMVPKFNNVRELSFQAASRVTSGLLTELADARSLESLESINLNGTFRKSIIPKAALNFCFDLMPRLKRLNISNNKMHATAAEAFFETINSKCRKMEVFEMENCLYVNGFSDPELDYAEFRQNCQSLKVFNISCTRFQAYYPDAELGVVIPGDCLDLREIYLCSKTALHLHQTPQRILGLVENCKNLEIINVCNLKHMDNFEFLLYLKTKKLRSLNISYLFTFIFPAQIDLISQVTDIFDRWRHCLEELNISGSTFLEPVWAAIFESFGKDPALRKLWLRDTDIPQEQIRFIVKRFEKLIYLNVCSKHNICSTKSIDGVFYEENLKELRKQL
ncbi:unnamed protein product [Dimorphilus gyrociliatus]|uniref:Uncharacterized protein n=1 Tax=Dimorphilus gyrociliatus TaxID=2664684 RepID=A0A7I8VZX9_9ANNE|nr:unnamed protein product [Dimorphilus gyrociliatus]